jgi:hypothetical protein
MARPTHYLRDLVFEKQDTHRTRSTTSKALQIGSRYGDRSFSRCGPYLLILGLLREWTPKDS